LSKHFESMSGEAFDAINAWQDLTFT
jgi:hypothetical protein